MITQLFWARIAANENEISLAGSTASNLKKKKKKISVASKSIMRIQLYVELIITGPFYITPLGGLGKNQQAPVVQKLDSTIHRISLYPVDNAIGFPRIVLSNFWTTGARTLVVKQRALKGQTQNISSRYIASLNRVATFSNFHREGKLRVFNEQLNYCGFTFVN